MSATGTILPQRRQPSQQTRDKAQRLDILMLTRFAALVQGDHDIYQVWRDTLECSCQAGQAGIVCSHRLAVEAATTPPPKQIRTYARYNPATGLFDVVQGSAVVGQVSSYLEMEANHDA
jgi:hypothetical protein